MKDVSDPISQASVDVPDLSGQARRKVRRGEGRALSKPQLKATSMIDVVFLLLIFFVVTASFHVDEAALQAKLPGNSTIGPTPPPPVLVKVDLRSSDDGVTYRLLVDGVPVDGASGLSAYMSNRLQAGQIASDDLVQITPQGAVRWQHVLNVYNACVNAELEQVTFARAN